MASDENDQIVVPEEDTVEEDFSPEELEDDTVDWKAKAEELKGIAKRRATQLKKLKDAATKAAQAAKAAAAAKEVDITPAPKPATSKTDEIDAVESLLLEVKGIQDPDEVELYEKWKTDTGRDGRQILNSKIFQKELEDLRAEKAVKEATPSSSKRGGDQAQTLDAAIARYEKTNELPDDFELRSAVVNALVARSGTNKPSYKL